MTKHVDVLIIGAGPAGLGAACSARSAGVSVVVLDDQPKPGGQLFRHITHPKASHLMAPSDYAKGMRLIEAFHASGAEYLANTQVWGIEGQRVFASTLGKAKTFTCSNLIIASGGMERPVPFSGWTLPGVLGAGAADILLRSHVPFPAKSLVLAGNGPLLLQVACHLIELGITIDAWLETGTWLKRFLAAPHLMAGVLDPSYMLRGAQMAYSIVKNRTRIISAQSIEAIGTNSLEAVRYTHHNTTHTIDASMLLRHEGVIPRTHIPNALKLDLAWDTLQRCYYVRTSLYGETKSPNIFVCGDGAYVHGGDMSIAQGQLTGLRAAQQLNVISAAEALHRGKKALCALKRLRLARNFLRYVFAPSPQIFDMPDEVTVCRCEQVTAGTIRNAVAQGLTDVNEIKRITRCGMGTCQGRMCGYALIEIAAKAQRTSPDTVGLLQAQQPYRSVTVKQYCDACETLQQ